MGMLEQGLCAVMQIRIVKIVRSNGFWLLSLLIHLFLLLSFTFLFIYQPEHQWEKKPALNIPSYLYHEAAASARQQKMQSKENLLADKTGLLNPAQSHQENKQQRVTNTIKANQSKAIHTPKNLQGVHLIGDKKLDEPLIKILGTALSAHLMYPKIAEDFGLRGVAFVGFTIHPDGQVTDVQLVKTSSTDVLDQAALAAVNAIAPVKNVTTYLNQPRHLVIGFIFG